MQIETPDGLAADMRRMAEGARDASRRLARAESRDKDAALCKAAQAILDLAKQILEANAEDLAQARQAGMTAGFQDRLELDEKRLVSISRAITDVAALPDPVGEVTSNWRRPNGLSVRKVRIPLGVILMIYEARPNVTTDAAALCLKSGNAVLLRPGSDALRSSLALSGAFRLGCRRPACRRARYRWSRPRTARRPTSCSSSTTSSTSASPAAGPRSSGPWWSAPACRW